MSLLDSEFRADRLNVHNLKLNGIDISNFQIETLGDGKYIDSLRGDIQVQITPSMLDASGNYVIQQIPGMGRFSRVELSTTVRPVYYLAPNGLDTNLGTKTSPWQTLTNVPNGSIVVLLNGTYSNTHDISSTNCLSCFFSVTPKYGLIIYGESRDGVIISRGDTIKSEDTFVYKQNYISIMNMTFSVIAERGVNSYNCAYTYLCGDVFFHNIDFRVNSDYSFSYGVFNTGTVIINECLFYGGFLKNDKFSSPYNYTNTPNTIPTISLNVVNPYINGTAVFASSVLDISNIVNTSHIVDIKTNTLIFKTDKRNFDTITLDIWLEQ